MNPLLPRFSPFVAACLCLGFLGGFPESSTGQTQQSATNSSASQHANRAFPERSFVQVRSEARQLLGAEAASRRSGEWPSWDHAVRGLVSINDELRYHSRNVEGSQLAKLKVIVAGRLKEAQERLLQTSRELDQCVSGESASEALFVLPIVPAAVAQQIQLPVQQGAQFGGGGAAGPFGGGGLGAGGVTGGPGQQPDNGEELVALIERTISADVWQSVGGPASITYFQPSLAIVVSAPGDTHDGIVNLLYQLRRAAGP